MTTIVITRNEIVGDTLTDDAGARLISKKIFKVGDRIIGIAGDRYTGLKFIRPDETPDKFDREKNNFTECLILEADGTMRLWDNAGEINDDLECEYWAIGTGRKAALAAMHMGATPKEAVRIAAVYDLHTNEKVFGIKRIEKLHD